MDENFKIIFILNSKHTGKNYKNKLNIVCNILKKRKINKLLITAPENLAWLLNIRGGDSKYSPLPNCHAILDNRKKITLIIEKNKINNKFKSHFKNFLNYNCLCNYNAKYRWKIFYIRIAPQNFNKFINSRISIF